MAINRNNARYGGARFLSALDMVEEQDARARFNAHWVKAAVRYPDAVDLIKVDDVWMTPADAQKSRVG